MKGKMTGFLTRQKNQLQGLAWDRSRLFFVCPVSGAVVTCGPQGKGYPLNIPTALLKAIAPALKWGVFFLKVALATQGLGKHTPPSIYPHPPLIHPTADYTLYLPTYVPTYLPIYPPSHTLLSYTPLIPPLSHCRRGCADPSRVAALPTDPQPGATALCGQPDVPRIRPTRGRGRHCRRYTRHTQLGYPRWLVVLLTSPLIINYFFSRTHVTSLSLSYNFSSTLTPL